MIDKITESRPHDACNKVSIIAHSAGVNAALISSIKVPDISEKVNMVKGLAPCIILNL